MKKISIEKLETLNGGDKSFIKGVCGGIAIMRAAAGFGLFALNPVAGSVLLGVATGCTIYSLLSD